MWNLCQNIAVFIRVLLWTISSTTELSKPLQRPSKGQEYVLLDRSVAPYSINSERNVYPHIGKHPEGQWSNEATNLRIQPRSNSQYPSVITVGAQNIKENVNPDIRTNMQIQPNVNFQGASIAKPLPHTTEQRLHPVQKFIATQPSSVVPSNPQPQANLLNLPVVNSPANPTNYLHRICPRVRASENSSNPNARPHDDGSSEVSTMCWGLWENWWDWWNPKTPPPRPRPPPTTTTTTTTSTTTTTTTTPKPTIPPKIIVIPPDKEYRYPDCGRSFEDHDCGHYCSGRYSRRRKSRCYRDSCDCRHSRRYDSRPGSRDLSLSLDRRRQTRRPYQRSYEIQRREIRQKHEYPSLLVTRRRNKRNFLD